VNTKLGKLNCECIWYTISLAFLSCIFRSRHDRRSRRGNEHSLFSRILRVQDASGLWSKLVVRWPLCDDKRIVGAPSSIGGWFIHWRMVHPLEDGSSIEYTESPRFSLQFIHGMCSGQGVGLFVPR
jgi:hypothetical protein